MHINVLKALKRPAEKITTELYLAQWFPNYLATKNPFQELLINIRQNVAHTWESTLLRKSSRLKDLTHCLLPQQEINKKRSLV